jgi:glycosyltransferase involved in cell wall biosynthesis
LKRPPDPDVSVLVPVYNERESLPFFLERLERVLGGWSGRAEVVFIDDSSRDGSARILDRFCASRPHARVVRHSANRGRGGAVLSGVRAARGEILVTIDADLENPPESIPSLVDGMTPDVSCMIGYRKGRPRLNARGAASGAYNLALAAFTGRRLHDCNSGLKAVRRDALLRPAVWKWLERDADYFRFLAILLHRSGLRTLELPVAYAGRVHGRSRYAWKRYFKAGVDFLRLMGDGMRSNRGRP